MSSLHELRMLDLISYTRQTSLNEPFGCAIYDEKNTCLVTAVGNKQSPINHAEINAINECAKSYPQIEWQTLSLYTTGEPCCMCAAACCWSNLKEVFFGADIPFMIELWGIESSLRAEEIIKVHPKKPFLKNICHEATNQFFLERKNTFATLWNNTRWSITTKN